MKAPQKDPFVDRIDTVARVTDRNHARGFVPYWTWNCEKWSAHLFVTVGLFMIVINAFILWLTERLITLFPIGTIGLTVEGIGSYIAAVVLLGILNYLFQKFLR